MRLPKSYLLWCIKQNCAGWCPKMLMCMGRGSHGWGYAVKLDNNWDFWLLAVLYMHGKWPRQQGQQIAVPEPRAWCVRPNGSACRPSKSCKDILWYMRIIAWDSAPNPTHQLCSLYSSPWKSGLDRPHYCRCLRVCPTDRSAKGISTRVSSLYGDEGIKNPSTYAQAWKPSSY